MGSGRRFLQLLEFAKVAAASRKNLISFFRRGASIASTQIIHAVKGQAPEIKTIFDVGANQGQFALAANYFYPDAIIYSFEPVPEVFALLQTNLKKCRFVTGFNYALGSESGEIDFFKNTYSHASSALPVSQLQTELFSNTKAAQKTVVPVRKLDEVVTDLEIISPVLLKLDVQGYEAEVLRGAGKFLERVDYLLLEVSFVEMYDGELLFEEMHSFIKTLGFKLVSPVGYLQSDSLQILQMDMLYKNER